MLTYNLLKGKVSIDKHQIKTDKKSTLNSIKWKFLSLVGAFYIFDRINLSFSKDNPLIILILKSVFYGMLSIFVLFSIYHFWIKIGFINSLKIENITKIIIYKDEDFPLNIKLKVKGKFNTIDLSFRETENDYQNFLNELRKRNSSFIIKEKNY